MAAKPRGKGDSQDSPFPKDQELFKNLARADLITELRPFVEAHAKSSARNKHDADDLMQEMFITLLEVSDTYSHLPKNEVIQIAKTSARNCVRDLMRKKKARNTNLPQVSLNEAIEVPMPQASDRESAADLLVRIDGLVTGRAREVLKRLIEGRTIIETARHLSVNETTVHRTLTDLRLMAQINFPEGLS